VPAVKPQLYLTEPAPLAAGLQAQPSGTVTGKPTPSRVSFRDPSLVVKAGHLAGQVPIRGGSMPGCSGVGVTSGAAALVWVCACCAWVVGFVPVLSSLLSPLVRTK
jgi:hypothetical protein